MKHVCPFCNKKFTRDPRSILSNEFCHRCIQSRINQSGGRSIRQDAQLVVDKAGYVTFPLAR